MGFVVSCRSANRYALSMLQGYLVLRVDFEGRIAIYLPSTRRLVKFCVMLRNVIMSVRKMNCDS